MSVTEISFSKRISFKDLVLIIQIQRKGESDEDIVYCSTARWLKWSNASNYLFDKLCCCELDTENNCSYLTSTWVLVKSSKLNYISSGG